METVKIVADRFGVGVVLDYSDPAMSLFGQARYENGELQDIRLASDFKQVDYLEKEDVYVYQNVRHRSLEKVSLMPLKDKIKQDRTDETRARLKR
jgi:hypothetical protein